LNAGIFERRGREGFAESAEGRKRIQNLKTRKESKKKARKNPITY
jgi:hypothetical protein